MNFEGLILVLKFEHSEHGVTTNVYEVRDQAFQFYSSLPRSFSVGDLAAWLEQHHYKHIIAFNPDDGISGMYQIQAG